MHAQSTQRYPCGLRAGRRQTGDSIKHGDAQLVRCSVQRGNAVRERGGQHSVCTGLCALFVLVKFHRRKEEMTDGEGEARLTGRGLDTYQAG